MLRLTGIVLCALILGAGSVFAQPGDGSTVPPRTSSGSNASNSLNGTGGGDPDRPPTTGATNPNSNSLQSGSPPDSPASQSPGQPQRDPDDGTI